MREGNYSTYCGMCKPKCERSKYNIQTSNAPFSIARIEKLVIDNARKYANSGYPPNATAVSKIHVVLTVLRHLNGDVLRNINMYSFLELCPLCTMHMV